MTDQLYEGPLLQSPTLLTSSVAHDFNNLITIIESYVGELELSVEHTDCLEMLAGIREATLRARSLSSSLLANGRNLTAPGESRTDLNQCVRRTMLLAQRLLCPDITIVVDLGAGDAIVTCSTRHIDQLLLNLVVNAQDAMPEGGTLHISTVRPTVEHTAGTSGWVELSVSDTGIGMNEETRRRIFEPFFTTKGPGKGSGLGLAIVHDRVLEAGGRVNVHSVEGEGSTFRLWLPLAPVTDAWQ